MAHLKFESFQGFKEKIYSFKARKGTKTYIESSNSAVFRIDP
jgi:hypothetical protein